MKALKFYKIATFLLLFLNVALVVVFLTHPAPDAGRRLAPEMVKMLELDRAQEATFFKMGKAHHDEISKIRKEQSDLLKKYFLNLKSDSAASDSISLQVQALESKKLSITYAHFEKVKKMLRTEQEPNFERFVSRVVEQLLIKKKGGHPPNKNKDLTKE